MKINYLVLISALIITSQTSAQSNYEIYMMGNQNTQGSGRSMALGGASASLGGDYTGVVNNPATLGIYRTSQMGMTMGLNIDNAYANVQSQEYLNQRVRASFNQFYFVGTNVRGKEKKNISSWSWGMGTNRVSNLNQEFNYYRTNTRNSFGDVVAYSYNAGLDRNQAWYAWDVGVLDTVNGQMQTSFDQNGAKLGQKQILQYKGSITDLNFSTAYNYQNKLMLGLGMGVPMGFMSKTINYTEDDADQSLANFNWYQYNESSRTSIIGVNAKLGVLYQPVANVRLAAFYQTPTSYSMQDTFYYNFRSDMEGYVGLPVPAQSSDYLGDFSYRLRGASNYGVSGTYLFDTKGLITFDYLRQNPQNNRMILNGQDPTLENDINTSLRREFQATNTFKLGLEGRLNRLYIRGGGNYSTSPYGGGGSYLGENYGFSLGIGGRSRNTSYDLTYVRQTTRLTDEPYYSGLIDMEARILNHTNRIVFSLGFR